MLRSIRLLIVLFTLALATGVSAQPQSSDPTADEGFRKAILADNQGNTDEAVRYYKDYLRRNPKATIRDRIETRIKWLETNPPQTILNYLLLNAAETGDTANVQALLGRGADANFKDNYNYKRPLVSAARGGYVEIVKLLLEKGAKDEAAAALAAAYEEGHPEIERLIERVTPQPLTADAAKRMLSAALRKGDATKFGSLVDLSSAKDRDELLLYALSQIDKPSVEIVRVLLDKGANVNQPTNYKTALMSAAAKGYNEIVSLLLARGAQVNAQTDEGTALMDAVASGNAETVKLLLAAGADVKAKHRLGDQALMIAARRHVAETAEVGAQILQLLLANGAEVNARGYWGTTALMGANTPAKVDLLVAKGAPVEAKNDEGETALLMAAERADIDVVSALLQHGADVNAPDKKGDTPLLRALAYETYGPAEEVAKRAAQHLAVARRLLDAPALNVDLQDADGETALMRGVSLGQTEIVRALLAKGADRNRPDVFGNTAVVLAYEKGNVELEKLLAIPAFKQQPPNVRNAFLRAAIGRKDEPRVRELLAAGADPNHQYAIDYSHKTITRTVLILAAQIGNPRIVQLLVNAGADVKAQGLLSGSEHGLVYGTALEAAEASKNSEVVAILKKALTAPAIKK
jgi:uncharacterized protein